MKKQDLGIGYIIIGYLLLPFIAIYGLLTNWIKDSTKDMGEFTKFCFYILLTIVILMLIELIYNLW